MGLRFLVWATAHGEPRMALIRFRLSGKQLAADTGILIQPSFMEMKKASERVLRNPVLTESELFVTTKLKNTDQGYDVLRAFEGSMKRLGLDYLDLYLIHWPVPAVFKVTGNVSRDTWRAFERLYGEGLVRSIGLSNFLPHHIDNI